MNALGTHVVPFNNPSRGRKGSSRCLATIDAHNVLHTEPLRRVSPLPAEAIHNGTSAARMDPAKIPHVVVQLLGKSITEPEPPSEALRIASDVVT